ncbi:hypothetical protein CERSUDRAFT_151372 [Gelatoporia subvermispora B]|uniref:Uncharacterized protein n=1 Tax=Ceriporiopsis subvermispora (strain B) TaxID=914234 RepID=M2PQC4_CERS8|nr:hypothetical protein CERSUDRAFT_151372 [Gelatoporia subvermispora B]
MDVASCPPLRTSAANALWGHLLRKDVASGLSKRDSSAISNPPIAPSDRTGTSLRILLHDTQANLEKFSERVNLLIDDVEGTKREVVTVRKAFEDEHEKLINETTDLVNRCQAEIRKHVGSPAQTSLVEDVQKTLASLDHKVNGLEQKLDVLQMVHDAALALPHELTISMMNR